MCQQGQASFDILTPLHSLWRSGTATCNIIDPSIALGRVVSAQGSGADPLLPQYLSPEEALVSKQLFQKYCCALMAWEQERVLLKLSF